ncbi:MAG: type II toxin-antitoxin system CcdA family antitoxin [Candidatus Anammoxibacter sp.]
MQQVFDINAQKKAANLSINSDLLSKARLFKINLSATFEQALAVQVREIERENWLKENKQAIMALNELADKNGLFSDSFRNF